MDVIIWKSSLNLVIARVQFVRGGNSGVSRGAAQTREIGGREPVNRI